MTVLTTQAYAKINLCLFVGPLRSDDQHEVVTLDGLADARRRAADGDGRARARRRRGHLPRDLRAESRGRGTARLPRRDGLGRLARSPGDREAHPDRRRHGWGSADAAAALRLAGEASGHGVGNRRLLEDIGATLGADVASQIRGGLVLATGTGRRLRPLNTSLSYSVVVVPVDAQLSSGAVYAEADRLGLPRDALELARSLTRTQAALSSETILNCLHNDLQDAARSLCPEIDRRSRPRLQRARTMHSFGLGPDVIGVFLGGGHRERAHRVCDSLVAEGRTPAPRLTRPAGRVSRG